MQESVKHALTLTMFVVQITGCLVVCIGIVVFIYLVVRCRYCRQQSSKQDRTVITILDDHMQEGAITLEEGPASEPTTACPADRSPGRTTLDYCSSTGLPATASQHTVEPPVPSAGQLVQPLAQAADNELTNEPASHDFDEQSAMVRLSAIAVDEDTLFPPPPPRRDSATSPLPPHAVPLPPLAPDDGFIYPPPPPPWLPDGAPAEIQAVASAPTCSCSTSPPRSESQRSASRWGNRRKQLTQVLDESQSFPAEGAESDVVRAVCASLPTTITEAMPADVLRSAVRSMADSRRRKGRSWAVAATDVVNEVMAWRLASNISELASVTSERLHGLARFDELWPSELCGYDHCTVTGRDWT